VPAPAPASGSNARQFDTAMNLLSKAQYDEAKANFRAYADANPDDDDLSAQSIYWVGDIDYVQRDYQGAITAFAEQIKKYPKSPRGPDSMLKLGQSLLAMGRTQEGCTTLGAIKSKFPDAPAATITLAAGTRKASCKS
jgi:tol-pal system protein YbgF